MIRLAVATIALISLLSSCALAQASTPKVQAFGGYSFTYADNGGLSGQDLDYALRELNSPFAINSAFSGWNVEGQYNANHWIGIVADVSGRYGKPLTNTRFSTLSGLPEANGYALLVGPVLTFRGKSKITPFIHVMFGFDRASLNASTITGLSTPVTSSATTYTDAALALGGGIDYRLFRLFSVRLFQADDLRTYHNLNKFYENVFSGALFYGIAQRQNNIRVSTGIVVRF
ncbi:MAG: outer membrane beta-barrel protein [Candidatus Sulfotelmatobacter sp.]